jgi:hypothetical protein
MFTYLETTVTNQIFIHDEINNGLNSGNACYHSVCLLPKNVKIEI